jgi:hypothetical protein
VKVEGIAAIGREENAPPGSKIFAVLAEFLEVFPFWVLEPHLIHHDVEQPPKVTILSNELCTLRFRFRAYAQVLRFPFASLKMGLNGRAYRGIRPHLMDDAFNR